MLRRLIALTVVVLIATVGIAVYAQQQPGQLPPAPGPSAPGGKSAIQELPPPAPPSATAPPPPAPNIIAAKVNDTPIPELAVFRAMPKSQTPRPELRPEIISYLIDNALVDQYLDQLKIEVEAKEIDTQVEKVKAEIVAAGWKVEDFYKELFLSEADLKAQIRATLRWDKFIQQFATEKALKDYFDSNKAMFDGSMVRAKHILVSFPPGSDPEAAEQAKAKIVGFKKQIEIELAQKLAAEPKLDNLELQKKKSQLLGDIFSTLAKKESDCPTKTNGGDLDWFTRGGGRVVEPFAKTAFTLKPGDMSEAVVTEYGCHLILCVDYRPGTERKFEDIRQAVKNVYADKMREAIVKQSRPKAKIEINAAPK